MQTTKDKVETEQPKYHSNLGTTNQGQSPSNVKGLVEERRSCHEQSSSQPSISPQQSSPSLLEQFKTKYDLLRSQYEEKKRQADTLMRDKKKLQIEMLNNNVEYYERQMGRLKQQVQKYQLENEENKHKYFVAQNQRKEQEASVRTKDQEVKSLLKQLEKEKIQVVELRYDNDTKAKSLMKIIHEMEASNASIATNIKEANERNQKLEAQLKTKKDECEKLKSQLDHALKHIQNLQETHRTEKEKLELQAYRSSNKATDIEEAMQVSTKKHEQQIKSLQERIKELKNQKISEDLLLAKKNDTALQMQNIRAKEIQVSKLEEKLTQSQFELKDKKKLIESLEKQLKHKCSIDLYEDAQKRAAEANSRRVNVQRAYEMRITELLKEMDQVKINSFRNPGEEAAEKGNFQLLLKAQIQENGKLRKELLFKVDQQFNLKTELDEVRALYGGLQNELQILQKKQRADENNNRISNDIEMQNLRNDVQSLQRKLEVCETKLAIKVKEVKDKDNFIKSTIIGRSKQEDVPFIVAELQRVFEADYISKLAEANNPLKELQSKEASK